MRILIDMDSVLFDIITPWLALHNNDHEHQMTHEHCTEWDLQNVCNAAGCNADIYSYLNDKRVWNNGAAIIDAYDITLEWVAQGYELAIVTAVGNSVAPNRKMSWLHNNFGHITNVLMTMGRNKHWITGDFLIDDAPHNLEHFTGISILYDQPWNRSCDKYPRANNWQDVYHIVQYGSYFLENSNFGHKYIEELIKLKIEKGEL